MTDIDRLELLRGTLAAYDRLRQKAIAEADPNEREDVRAEWPELTLVAVEVRPETGLTHEEVSRQLVDCTASPGVQGWIRYRSRAVRFGGDGKVWNLGGDGEAGPPIAAEWSDATTGGQLRLCPEYGQPGGFALWRYAERKLDLGEATTDDEIPALRQRVWVLEHPAPRERPPDHKPIPCLAYHVFWGADEADPSALRRLFARFTGFEQRADRYRETPRRARRREA